MFRFLENLFRNIKRRLSYLQHIIINDIFLRAKKGREFHAKYIHSRYLIYDAGERKNVAEDGGNVTHRATF